MTGGAGGLGATIAEGFLGAGFSVVITGRHAETLAATARSLDPSGERVVSLVCDNRNENDVATLVDMTLSRFGRIDVLVNNSGIAGPTCPLWEYSITDWQDTIDTNLTGTFLCCRAVLPTMIGQGSGSIVTIGSVTGKRPNPGRAGYAASKTALIGLTRTLAAEAGPHGVRINLVSPGAIDSDRFRAVIDAMAESQSISAEVVLGQAVSESPLGRLVAAADVSAAVVFLGSDRAASITGEDLNVSAGLVMY
ncbi:SDR family NAD(P)-dependent oxidoreductase [Kribbella sp. NPDC051587]|uniref:SDR family NAD(P)-dependent oxidoreductase n=1 Tax=Kribbella sp. NPDC051587 TaxID=3364119 RepID=UPI0037A93697